MTRHQIRTSTRTRHETSRHHVRVVALAGALLGAASMTLSTAAPATASPWVKGTVHASGGLKVRTVPSAHAPTPNTLANGSDVQIDCQIKGTRVSGNATWYELKYGGWISGEYVRLRNKKPDYCTPGTSTSVTTTKDTTAYEGPSTRDRRATSVSKGDFEAWCYASTHVPGPGNDKIWVAGVESGWVRGNAVTATKDLPYCSKA